jgi:DNA-binding LytR/AlgR family response regulator
MNCLIVDDDRGSAKLIENYIGKTNFLQYLHTCYSPIDAANFLRKNKVDLIFLDIELPEMSGLDLAQTLSKDTQVIFMSAQANYAVKAFEIDVTDYMQKPISYKRFLDSVQKANKREEEQDVLESKDHIFVKSANKLLKISIDDIRWIEAMSDYIMIHTKEKRHLVLSSLKAIEDKLPSRKFLRSHRSFIVSIDKIVSIDDSAIVIDDKTIPLGKTYKTKFLQSIRTI